MKSSPSAEYLAFPNILWTARTTTLTQARSLTFERQFYQYGEELIDQMIGKCRNIVRDERESSDFPRV